MNGDRAGTSLVQQASFLPPMVSQRGYQTKSNMAAIGTAATVVMAMMKNKIIKYKIQMY